MSFTGLTSRGRGYRSLLVDMEMESQSTAIMDDRQVACKLRLASHRLPFPAWMRRELSSTITFIYVSQTSNTMYAIAQMGVRFL